VIQRAHEVRELWNTGGFDKQNKYLTKIQKSMKHKEKQDKQKFDILVDSHGKKTGQVEVNLKDIDHRLRD